MSQQIVGLDRNKYMTAVQLALDTIVEQGQIVTPVYLALIPASLAPQIPPRGDLSIQDYKGALYRLAFEYSWGWHGANQYAAPMESLGMSPMQATGHPLVFIPHTLCLGAPSVVT